MDTDAFSIVTNVNDAGDGSFRQVILDNNAETMPGTVTFDPLLNGSEVELFGTIDISNSLTVDFDSDGDGVGDISLFSGLNTPLFTFNTDLVTLTLDGGDIVYDTDEEALGGFPFSVFSVDAEDVTIENSSDIIASGIDTIEGELSGDPLTVFNVTADDFTLTNAVGSTISTTGTFAGHPRQNFE